MNLMPDASFHVTIRHPLDPVVSIRGEETCGVVEEGWQLAQGSFDIRYPLGALLERALVKGAYDADSDRRAVSEGSSVVAVDSHEAKSVSQLSQTRILVDGIVIWIRLVTSVAF